MIRDGDKHLFEESERLFRRRLEIRRDLDRRFFRMHAGLTLAPAGGALIAAIIIFLQEWLK